VVLQEEGIESADAFLALTNDDEDNIIASLLARRLGVGKVVALVNRLNYLPLAQRLGVQHDHQPATGRVDGILQFVRKGRVLSVTTFREEEAEAIELVVSAGARNVGKRLRDIRFPAGAIVGAIARPDGEVVVPRWQRGDPRGRPRDLLRARARRPSPRNRPSSRRAAGPPGDPLPRHRVRARAVPDGARGADAPARRVRCDRRAGRHARDARGSPGHGPAGVLLWRFNPRPTRDLTQREALLLVCATWTGSAAFGGLPFYLSPHFASFTDAFFEPRPASRPPAPPCSRASRCCRPDPVLRHFSHWLGGMGIVLLGIAILPLVGHGGAQLYRAEFSGARSERLKPRLAETRRRSGASTQR